MTEATLTEGCLCGAVRYRLHAPLGPIVLCHCRDCRKAQGSAFAANSPVPARSWEITEGESHIRVYASSPAKERWFCERCGSPLISRRIDHPETVRLRVGSLDQDPPQPPAYHIFAASAAAWHRILDDLPRYAAWGPEQDADAQALPLCDTPLLQTPASPYWVVVFSSRRRPGDHGYAEMTARIAERLEGWPGLLGYESVRESGYGITCSYWRDEDAIRAWAGDHLHQQAQSLGKTRWYEDYVIRIARVERAYGWERQP